MYGNANGHEATSFVELKLLTSDLFIKYLCKSKNGGNLPRKASEIYLGLFGDIWAASGVDSDLGFDNFGLIFYFEERFLGRESAKVVGKMGSNRSPYRRMFEHD